MSSLLELSSNHSVLGDQDVRGSCKEHDCGNEGEEREDEKTESVQHDGSVLPVVDCHSHLLGCADVLSYHSEIKNCQAKVKSSQENHPTHPT